MFSHGECSCVYLKTFVVRYIHVGLMNAKPQWQSDLGDLGTNPSGDSPKSQGTICVVQSRRSWELGVPSQFQSSLPRVGFQQDCISFFPTHFCVGIFRVTLQVEITQLLSEFLSERIDLYVAIYLVCFEEKGKSGASYVTILILLSFLEALLFDGENQRGR